MRMTRKHLTNLATVANTCSRMKRNMHITVVVKQVLYCQQ